MIENARNTLAAMLRMRHENILPWEGGYVCPREEARKALRDLKRYYDSIEREAHRLLVKDPQVALWCNCPYNSRSSLHAAIETPMEYMLVGLLPPDDMPSWDRYFIFSSERFRPDYTPRTVAMIDKVIDHFWEKEVARRPTTPPDHQTTQE